MRTQTSGGSGGDVRGRSDGSGVCQKNGGCHRERGKPRDAERNEKKGIWQLKCRSGRTRDAPRSRAKADASRRQGLENSGIVR